MGWLYVSFWVGAFVLVLQSRVIPSHLPLSEVTTFATGLATTTSSGQKVRQSSLFVTSAGSLSAVEQVVPSSGQMSYVDTVYQNRKVDAVRVFLEKYRSPMAPYANVVVSSAEKHGIDYRIVVSIAMVESGAGKVVPGDGRGGSSFNAWGWRNGESYRVFDDWGEGIEYISWRLAEGYGRDRLKPEIMEISYCPPCHRDNPGAWSGGVKKFMGEISSIYNKLGSS